MTESQQGNAMASPFSEQMRASLPGHPGMWRVGPGRAVTLQPGEPGMLCIAHGMAWITGDGPHPGPLNDQGDRFLAAGERLPLLRGQRLVIEAFDRRQPAWFSWDPLPQAPALERKSRQWLAKSRRALKEG